MGEKEKENQKETKKEQPSAICEPKQEIEAGDDSEKEEDEVATEV